MLRELKAYRLFADDTPVLADTIARLSWLAQDHGDVIGGLVIDPHPTLRATFSRCAGERK
jgi:glutathione S-transferase